uniref:Uncharacterized protein n=1 Tax=Amazona collaria TaxID=241587 RepID=A0A8B9GCU5_9PSIT
LSSLPGRGVMQRGAEDPWNSIPVVPRVGESVILWVTTLSSYSTQGLLIVEGKGSTFTSELPLQLLNTLIPCREQPWVLPSRQSVTVGPGHCTQCFLLSSILAQPRGWGLWSHLSAHPVLTTTGFDPQEPAGMLLSCLSSSPVSSWSFKCPRF